MAAGRGETEASVPGGPEAPAWAESVFLLGMHMHNVTLRETVEIICRAVAHRSRGYVVTPNTHHVVLFRRDPAFRRACEGAALRLADGMPLVWASRFLGHPLRARVTGADLLPAVCGTAAARGFSVYLCGGRAGVAERAAARLSARFERLRIAGTHTPPERFGEDGGAQDAACEAVRLARPDILFVGLGAPAQEIWTHRYWDRLQVPVAICCGAAIDFAAGTSARAPSWMQGAGLEWLWRLGHEPRRLWRRYLVQNAAFLGIFMKEWWDFHVGRGQ